MEIKNINFFTNRFRPTRLFYYWNINVQFILILIMFSENHSNSFMIRPKKLTKNSSYFFFENIIYFTFQSKLFHKNILCAI